MLRTSIKRILAGQITLRTILLLTTLVAIGLGWWVPRYQRPQRFDMAGKQLLKQGAPVLISGRWGEADLRIVAASGDRNMLNADDVDVIRIVGPARSIALDSTTIVDLEQMARLFRLSGLTKLDVEANASRPLDKVLETLVKSRASVEQLRLSDGTLIAECGPLLAKLGSLRKVSLDLCETGPPNLTLDQLPKLESLSLDRCNVERLTLKSLPELIEFDCRAAPATKVLTLSISDMPSLERMTLVTGSKFETEWIVEGCPRLQQLHLFAMAVNGEHLRRLATSAVNLQELSIDGVYECLDTRQEARELARLRQLETLRIAYACPSRGVLREIARLPRLQRLKIHSDDCREDNEPRWYAPDYKLSLEEHRKRWPSNAWEELQRCREVTDLQLWTTIWNPQDLAWIGRLPKLKRLDLSRCRIKLRDSWKSRPLQDSDLAWLNNEQGIQSLWLEAPPGPELPQRLTGTRINYGPTFGPF